MAFTRTEIEGLLRLVGWTQDEEIHCDQCLEHVAEFAERQLAGKSLPEGLQAVEQHLAVCAECREEYEVLQRALSKMDP